MAIEDVCILPVIGLDKVGQSNSPVDQPRVFLGRKPAGRQSDLCQRLPEAIARVGIVGPSLPGDIPQRRTAEDDTQTVSQYIWDKLSGPVAIRPRLQLAPALFMSVSHVLSIAM